jgi:hypothetical protein
MGILRLSHKYDVPYLRRRALEYLGTLFPTTLRRYDTRKENLIATDVYTSYRLIMPLEVATEVGAPWLLPVAYYELCTQEISWIISEPGWKDLGEQERDVCLIGHSAQARYSPNILGFLTISKDSDADCDDWVECNRLRLQFASSYNWSEMTWPLDGAERWTEMDELGICETCIEEAKAIHAVARQTFWDQMPQMFSLPGWEELEEMRRVALAK